MQGVSSATSVPVVQAPVVESQVPGLWHSSAAAQLTAVPTQVEPLQASSVVQGSPSLQGAVASGVCAHPVLGLQLSMVQGLLSSQFRGVPEQPEEPQLSSSVQRLPSSHEMPVCGE